jgi:hypothetical protein
VAAILGIYIAPSPPVVHMLSPLFLLIIPAANEH